MKHQYTVQFLHLLLIAALVTVFTMSVAPVQSVHAQETYTSDLGVTIVAIPKHVKACQTFEATFTVTNYGPDPVPQLNLTVMLPDPFEFVGFLGAPESLAVGETVTFSAAIKVVAFVPGEPRTTWIGIDASSERYPDSSIDPNQANNGIFQQIKMIGKTVMTCP
jgi:hypothetical protein